jgi:hypothetical protein
MLSELQLLTASVSTAYCETVHTIFISLVTFFLDEECDTVPYSVYVGPLFLYAAGAGNFPHRHPVLGYGLDDRGSRFRFPAGAGNFSLYHCIQNGYGAHPASYAMQVKLTTHLHVIQRLKCV